MVFRAKCTAIVATVESLFNTNKCPIVRDTNNFYIEVKRLEVAEVIEKLNSLEVEKQRTLVELLSKI